MSANTNEIRLPELGEGPERIGPWLVKPGDAVKPDQNSSRNYDH